MVDHTTLNARELQLYKDAISNSGLVRTRVFILDKNENNAAEITGGGKVMVLDGNVDVSVGDNDVTRRLSMLLFDPKKLAMLDPNTPSATSLFMDRFVRASYGVYVSALSRWVDCNVFTGPITKLEQDGVTVKVEAMGKEMLLLEPALYWRTRTFHKGTRYVNAIKQILIDKGEQFRDIPTRKNSMHKPMSFVGSDIPWRMIQSMARTMNMQAYYDGSGLFHLRAYPKNSTFTFEIGDEGNILTQPSQPLDFTEVSNIVQVRGPKPDQKDAKRITGTARLAAAHAMSAQSLSRNGKPRALVQLIEMDHLKEKKKAHNEAVDILERASSLASEFKFDALVVPFLDEMDVVTVKSDIGTSKFALRQYTIPLTVQSSMSISYNKRARITRVRPKVRH